MSEPTVTVVMIEDDRQIRRFVRATLEAQGMNVIEAETGHRGLREAATRKPDLIVVDLGLPDADGIDVIRELRNWSSQPVIVLSARTHEETKVAALDAGADDYLTKPFGVSELLARIRAQLRRRNRGGEQETPQVCFGKIAVDMAARRVTRDGVAIHLTPIEYRLLTTLVRHAGRVLTHQQLLREVWGPMQAEQPVHIVTETGVGYRLVGAQ
jgi:two-component system KDP operon response regulator KdpE